jgi:hypothetical protein
VHSALHTLSLEGQGWGERLGGNCSNEPSNRLILGSHYPVSVSPLWPGAAEEIDWQEWADAAITANPFERNVKVICALGFGAQVLTNAERVPRLG